MYQVFAEATHVLSMLIQTEHTPWSYFFCCQALQISQLFHHYLHERKITSEKYWKTGKIIYVEHKVMALQVSYIKLHGSSQTTH